MKPEELRAFFAQRGTAVTESAIQNATRFKGPDGEVFCLYDFGKLVLQGNVKTELARDVDAFSTGGAAGKAAAPVFIVYGHDTGARDNLELLLRRMGLEPIVLANLPGSCLSSCRKVPASSLRA
jgi:predicted nucleotide-binding protein